MTDRLGNGYEVVTVDLPGHGASSTVVADLPGTADLVADAAGAGCYVGYSMGGRVLLHLALRRPELVRSMVLISTTAGIDDPDERTRRRQADDALALHIEAIGVMAFLEEWLSTPLFAGLDRSAEMLASRISNTPTGLANSLRASGTGTQQPLWFRLSALTMPIRIICGANDEKFVDQGRRLVDAIGANASLEVFEGSGHALHLEDPDLFTTSLRRWLEQHATR